MPSSRSWPPQRWRWPSSSCSGARHHAISADEFEVGQYRHAECRARQRADLCGGRQIARHLHDRGRWPAASSSLTASANSTRRSPGSSKTGGSRFVPTTRRCSPPSPSASPHLSITVVNWRGWRRDDAAAAREWGEASRQMRQALNADIEQLTALYAERARHAYADINGGLNNSAISLSLFALLGAAREHQRPGHIARRRQAAVAKSRA